MNDPERDSLSRVRLTEQLGGYRPKRGNDGKPRSAMVC